MPKGKSVCDVCNHHIARHGLHGCLEHVRGLVFQDGERTWAFCPCTVSVDLNGRVNRCVRIKERNIITQKVSRSSR